MPPHLLLVSYLFPPDGGGGVQRPSRLAKYLPRFGWKLTVLTREAPNERGLWDPADRSLLDGLHDDASVKILRAPLPERATGWARRLGRLDLPKAWLESAFETIRALPYERREVVLLTMSPFGLAHLGMRLQRELHARVVYDLRDPWALDPWHLYGSGRQWVADLLLMRRALKSADGVIINTPDASNALHKAMPRLERVPSIVVTNGFDPDEFADSAPRSTPGEDDTFRLVHTGTFHSAALYRHEGLRGLVRRLRNVRPPPPIDPSGRTPLHLLRAVRLLRDRGDPLAERLRLVFAGPADEATRRCVAESGVADAVELVDYLAHEECIACIRTADALFLPLHGSPSGARSRIVPGKAYEYLASGRPILACLPPGDALDFVRRYGRAVEADPCRAGSIADALVRLAGLPPEAPPNRDEFAERFSRVTLAERLAEFLTHLETP